MKKLKTKKPKKPRKWTTNWHGELERWQANEVRACLKQNVPVAEFARRKRIGPKSALHLYQQYFSPPANHVSISDLSIELGISTGRLHSAARDMDVIKYGNRSYVADKDADVLREKYRKYVVDLSLYLTTTEACQFLKITYQQLHYARERNLLGLVDKVRIRYTEAAHGRGSIVLYHKVDLIHYAREFHARNLHLFSAEGYAGFKTVVKAHVERFRQGMNEFYLRRLVKQGAPVFYVQFPDRTYTYCHVETALNWLIENGHIQTAQAAD